MIREASGSQAIPWLPEYFFATGGNVIDRPGLMLVPDANRLCSDRASDSGLLLPTGVMVEGFERRLCFKGEVLDPDVPRPANSWSVERVKVLNGPNTGLEGWVLAYGISGDD